MNKIPFAVVSFLAVQLGGAIWWPFHHIKFNFVFFYSKIAPIINPLANEIQTTW